MLKIRKKRSCTGARRATLSRLRNCLNLTFFVLAPFSLWNPIKRQQCQKRDEKKGWIMAAGRRTSNKDKKGTYWRKKKRRWKKRGKIHCGRFISFDQDFIRLCWTSWGRTVNGGQVEDGGARRCSVFCVVRALRHNPPPFHLHADQQPLPAGGVCRLHGLGACGVRPLDGVAEWGDAAVRVWGLSPRESVCVQARTGIGRFVFFRYLSKREVWF